MSTDNKLLLVLLIIALVIVPLITIWSLNTLFPALVIPYTFETWLATVILGASIKSTVRTKE
jgi:hypothetical protein